MKPRRSTPGADLAVMERDARRMRGDGLTVFAQVTAGVAIAEIAARITDARARMLAAPRP
jgi:urease accessory protein